MRAKVGFATENRKTGEMWVIVQATPPFGGRLAWSSGWKEIWLTTDTDESVRAIGFYRPQGWQDWKIEHGDRYMRKTIDSGR